MTDPLAEVVLLLRPSAGIAKVVSAVSPWRVRRSESGSPFYCLVIDGSCRLTMAGSPPAVLEAGDFVLIPALHDYTVSSLEPPEEPIVDRPPITQPNGEYRLGDESGPADVRMLVGHCSFGSPDAGLLVSLLPQRVHVRGKEQLTTLVGLVIDETRARRPARDVVLARLLEVLFIEALRSATLSTASPGLARGLADDRLAAALRRMHEDPTRAWSVDELAKEAALSRSAFFDRFKRTVGVAPMEYLLAWRMALAKKLLRETDGRVAEVAARVGYGSASTFSVAFTRHVGRPPARYAAEAAGA